VRTFHPVSNREQLRGVAPMELYLSADRRSRPAVGVDGRGLDDVPIDLVTAVQIALQNEHLARGSNLPTSPNASKSYCGGILQLMSATYAF